jgi:muramidase (phage lysozyme)
VLNSYHVTDKVVIAMDTDPETLDWIKKGGIAATIAQKPYTMADVGIQMLDNPLSSQAGAGQRLVKGYLCACPQLRGYWFRPDRQDERRFVSASRKESDLCTQVRTGRLPGTTKPNFPQGNHVAP